MRGDDQLPHHPHGLRIPGADPLTQRSSARQERLSHVHRTATSRVEALGPAESAVGMALEATLAVGARNIVALLLVAPQFGRSKQFVLVRKDLFMACAQVTEGSAASCLGRWGKLTIKHDYARS